MEYRGHSRDSRRYEHPVMRGPLHLRRICIGMTMNECGVFNWQVMAVNDASRGVTF
jgi:hypothetical protein